jgi:hypothetical protein
MVSTHTTTITKYTPLCVLPCNVTLTHGVGATIALHIRFSSHTLYTCYALQHTLLYAHTVTINSPFVVPRTCVHFTHAVMLVLRVESSSCYYSYCKIYSRISTVCSAHLSLPSTQSYCRSVAGMVGQTGKLVYTSKIGQIDAYICKQYCCTQSSVRVCSVHCVVHIDSTQ